MVRTNERLLQSMKLPGGMIMYHYFRTICFYGTILTVLFYKEPDLIDALIKLVLKWAVNT